MLESTLPPTTDLADLSETVVPLASLLLERGDAQSVNRAHGALCEVSNMGVWTVESEREMNSNNAATERTGATAYATTAASAATTANRNPPNSPPPPPPTQPPHNSNATANKQKSSPPGKPQ